MKPDFTQQLQQELFAIADWWVSNTIDETHGGFIGEITVDNRPVPEASKGVILNTRILWFFSEVEYFSRNTEKAGSYLRYARRAYDYLVNNFLDRQDGGVYWELTAEGGVRNSRKQIYAQAFAIYGLASYFKLTGDETAINLAYKIFELIEAHALDRDYDGYIEAFNGDWSELRDFRLSEKDMNTPKSMNTHLHILEAYTNLYAVDKHVQVGNALRRCLRYFDEYIINHQAGHLRMFLSMTWEDQSDSWSYGHDIESSWLIWETLELLGDASLIEHFKPMVLQLAETCLQQAIGEHGEMLDAFNFKTDTLMQERVWWVQAEALLSVLTLYRATREPAYLAVFEMTLGWIEKAQVDWQGGEWHREIDADGQPRGAKFDRWKCPYHNGRAILESLDLAAGLLGRRSFHPM